MKKILTTIVFLVATLAAMAQAEIQFEKTKHDFGTFPETQAVQKCVFKFTNVGDKPLIIHQAVTSCGCTVPSYTKTPIAPGESGEIAVTYNGSRSVNSHFKKIITVRSNAKTEMVRLYIEGEMIEVSEGKTTSGK